MIPVLILMLTTKDFMENYQMMGERYYMEMCMATRTKTLNENRV